MKIILKLFIVFTLFIGFTTSCKKYVDGPAFSLRTKKARLCGDWKIQSVTVNGNDMTSAFNTLLGANYVLDIEKDGGYKATGTFSDDGKWSLGEDGDDVYFTSSKPGSLEQANRILRLKNKELWLKQTGYNGDVTITKYIPAD